MKAIQGAIGNTDQDDMRRTTEGKDMVINLVKADGNNPEGGRA